MKLAHVDADTLAQTILLESARPVFHQIAWERPNQLRLIDENEQAWIFKLYRQTLESAAQSQSAPNPTGLTTVATEEGRQMRGPYER